MDGEKSMLFENRETRTPKKEGRPRRERAPLRVYIALVFFLIFFPTIARADRITDQEFGSDDYQQTLAIVARACPQVASRHLHAREMLCACARELNEQTADLCRRGQGDDYACGAMRAACRGLK